LLKSLGLLPGEYFLQITRFEPENNPLLTIDAYSRLKTDKKLVLVGGVPYESKYSRQIKSEAKDGVIMPGFIYDKELLNELWCNCYAYIHGNEVGGTNPALLQAMASSCITIAIDVLFSRDVLSDGGIYFVKDPENLASKMQWTLEHPTELKDYKQRALERIREHYSWDKVTDGYELLFNELVAGKYS
jgi:glycosyltransferase involved in cell wall biosynthesis